MYDNREDGGVTVDSIVTATGFPKSTINYELEDMQMLKIVKKTTRKPASISKTKRRPTKSSRVIYRLTKKFLDLLNCIEKGPSA
jgi:predicted transcriptional regulator